MKKVVMMYILLEKRKKQNNYSKKESVRNIISVELGPKNDDFRLAEYSKFEVLKVLTYHETTFLEIPLRGKLSLVFLDVLLFAQVSGEIGAFL